MDTGLRFAAIDIGSNAIRLLFARIIENGNDIYIKKAGFSLLTVQLHGTYFFDTLREKFFWGHDSRNTQ